MIEAIGFLYQGKKARVMTPDGKTDFFEIQTGVLQGDTLAPYIFSIVLDYAMRRVIDGREEELMASILTKGGGVVITQWS